MKIYFKKNNPDAIIPKHNHSTDAGMDVFALEDVYIPGIVKCLLSLFKREVNRRLIKTGISLQGSDKKKGNFYLRVADTSGNGLKVGVHVLGGVVDSTYRGDIGVILYNTNLWGINIKKGDKIAQLVTYEVPNVEPEEVFEHNDTERGEKGFGSSGTITQEK